MNDARPYNVRKVEEGTYAILRSCPLCGTVSEVLVPAQGLWDWEHGMLIQQALPGLSADDREVLMSGICGPCYDF